MPRSLTLALVFVLVFVSVVNVGLLVQTRQLRQQVATLAQQAAARPSAEQVAEVDELNQRLREAEEDRAAATREAASLRSQLGQVQSAATERDTLKTQVDALKQENGQLRNQVTNLQTMNDINGKVTELRGLAPRSPVPREFMNQAQLREHFATEISQTTDAEIADQRAVLRALDMGGEDATDLRQSQIDDLADSVLGFYEHSSKRLVVVTNRPTMGVGDRVTYAHEYTHSLQDQHYDLAGLFARAAGNSDYAMAIRGLVEGDATVSMSIYAQNNLTAFDMANYQIEQIQRIDLTNITLGASGPIVESAAAFPYQEGAVFVAALFSQGGWAEVTRVFANPPRSTEQVLHPEKFYEGDEPVVVRLPNLSAGLGGGWQLVTEDTLGELYTRIYLEIYLPFEVAIPAGEGWDGDRYQVLRDGQGRLALALQTAWDSPEEAAEFAEAYSDYLFVKSGGTLNELAGQAGRWRWQVGDRQYYLSVVGSQVLVLHAPTGETLAGMIGQLPGF